MIRCTPQVVQAGFPRYVRGLHTTDDHDTGPGAPLRASRTSGGQAAPLPLNGARYHKPRRSARSAPACASTDANIALKQ
jgi:hypothetical protein